MKLGRHCESEAGSVASSVYQHVMTMSEYPCRETQKQVSAPSTLPELPIPIPLPPATILGRTLSVTQDSSCGTHALAFHSPSHSHEKL